MIESFQKIVEILTKNDKSEKQRDHLKSRVKEEFQHFYQDLDVYLAEIQRTKTSRDFNLSRGYTPYQNTQELNTLDRSKTLETRGSNDRHLDLPFKEEYTSFYDNLADSQNPYQYTSKLGSSPIEKKKLLDSWQSHVNNLLSNDKKY